MGPVENAFVFVPTVQYRQDMADAVDEARSILFQRRTELVTELTKIDAALLALAPAKSTAVSAVQGWSSENTPTIRSLVLRVLESNPGTWSPTEMAAYLQNEGEIEDADEAIKGIRTTFWSLRNDGLARSTGAGRGTRTYAAKWDDDFENAREAEQLGMNEPAAG